MRRITRVPARAIALALAALSVLLVPLAAQQRPGRSRAQDRSELEQRVRARFGEMVKQRLGLTDDQARRLDETVRSFQQDRMRLGRENQAVRKRTEALLLEGGGTSTEAKDLLDRMQDLRMQEVRLSQTEREKLLDVLTPMQLLRFQSLREQMGRRIQRLRREPGGGPVGEASLEFPLSPGT